MRTQYGSILAIIAVAMFSGCATTDELYADYDCQLCKSETRIITATATATSEVQIPGALGIPWEQAVYFPFDSDALRPEEIERLDHNLVVLNDNPEAVLLIRGFTDSFGRKDYNDDLAKRRIMSVREYLNSRGLAPSRIVEADLGENAFLSAANSTATERGINRRVEMLLIDRENKPYQLMLEGVQVVTNAPQRGDEGNRYLRDIDEVANAKQGMRLENDGTVVNPGLRQVVTQPSRYLGKSLQQVQASVPAPIRAISLPIDQPGAIPPPDELDLAVAAWTQAWSEQNVDAYINAYVAGYAPQGMTHAQWRKQREQRIRKPSSIKVEVHDLIIVSKSLSRAVVKGEQKYRSNTYKDKTMKEWTLVRQNGQWKIERESAL